MTPSVPLGQALDQAREIAALRAEVERLEHNTEAYRGALGYSVRGSHDGLLRVAARPINGIAEALTAEVEQLRIAHARADGALADAETVPTGDLERGIRALTAERDGLRGDVRALAEALEHIGQRDLDEDEWCCCGHGGVFDGTRDSGHASDCRNARAALAREGVVRVRGEETR